jgi:hypothetical protein
MDSWAAQQLLALKTNVLASGWETSSMREKLEGMEVRKEEMSLKRVTSRVANERSHRQAFV